MAQVAIQLNTRTYRFACDQSEVQRLEDIANYLKSKIEGLMQVHGAVGDERLMLMAALMVADELFDARADVDQLLESGGGEMRSLAARTGGETQPQAADRRLKA